MYQVLLSTNNYFIGTWTFGEYDALHSMCWTPGSKIFELGGFRAKVFGSSLGLHVRKVQDLGFRMLV